MHAAQLCLELSLQQHVWHMAAASVTQLYFEESTLAALAAAFSSCLMARYLVKAVFASLHGIRRYISNISDMLLPEDLLRDVC